MTAVQLSLDVDPARRCRPWRQTTVGDGWNETCASCWHPVRKAEPDYRTPCSCATLGCHECGAAIGEPGCEFCWHADADGYRITWCEALAS